MPVRVEEATDADIPIFVEVEALAYLAEPPIPAEYILFPNRGFGPETRQRRIRQIIDLRKNDPTTVYLKAIDEMTHESVAFAKWNIYDTEEKSRNAMGRLVPKGSHVNEAACEAFFGGMGRKKDELLGGKPHIHFGMLHTHPKFQKRGAASALIQWGVKKGEELNLPVYLEASGVGHPLYHKHGFEYIDVHSVDLTPYGGKGITHRAPIMMKDAPRKGNAKL